MSFILDALRKSERERQRNQGPGVAEFGANSKRSNRGFWIPLVMLLVGLNISLLVFLWIKGSADPATEIAIADTDSKMAVSESASTRPRPVISGGQADLETRRLSAEIPVEDTVPRTSVDAAKPAPASPPASRNNSNSYENLPSLLELSLAGTIDLAPMRLDIHVYSDQPAERFVFINMKKYREGDSLVEGPVLEAITGKGIVLVYQGRSFVVTRE
jgi:general secretion pathway protein B